MPVWAYGSCFKSYLSNKFDRPETILDQAEMNLAAHGVRENPLGAPPIVIILHGLLDQCRYKCTVAILIQMLSLLLHLE